MTVTKNGKKFLGNISKKNNSSLKRVRFKSQEQKKKIIDPAGNTKKKRDYCYNNDEKNIVSL